MRPDLEPLTEQQQIAVLAYEATGLVQAAADAAGCSRNGIGRWRRDNPDFAIAWQNARDTIADIHEDELHRRAVTGIDEPIFYKGENVATVKRYSDGLLMFALKGLRPTRYRDTTRMEMAGDSAPPEDMDDTQAAARLAALLAAAEHRKKLAESAVDIDDFA